MTRSLPTVKLYARPDCHLCDEARRELEALREREAKRNANTGGREGRPFILVEIDIDSDDELLRRHLERIPVVELDGEEVSALGLDAEVLRARLATVSG